MKMPLHLKIVIGLLALAIISKVLSIAKYGNIEAPGTYTLNLLWIVVWIGIIKGLINRSNIARKLAIGLAIISAFLALVAIFLFSSIPLPDNGNFSLAYTLSFIVIFTDAYTIWALLTKKVVAYFNHNKSKIAQQGA